MLLLVLTELCFINRMAANWLNVSNAICNFPDNVSAGGIQKRGEGLWKKMGWGYLQFLNPVMLGVGAMEIC